MITAESSTRSTILASRERTAWLRPKYLLFAGIGVMLAYVIAHDESFLVHPNDPIWQHYEPFKWWLLPHGIAGGCALLLAPMQFSDRLRPRFRQWHRVVGRIYVACVFVAAPLGVYIQYWQERLGAPRSFSVAAAVDAALWMTTTGIALAFIRKGKVHEHRQWMTRSFAVALVFLEGRVIGGVTGWDNLDIRVTETIVWACLAFSIFSADFVLQWQQTGLERRVLYQGEQLSIPASGHPGKYLTLQFHPAPHSVRNVLVAGERCRERPVAERSHPKPDEHKLEALEKKLIEARGTLQKHNEDDP